VNGLSDRVNGLGDHVNGLSGRVNALGEHVNGLSDHMNGLGDHVNVLSGQVNGLGDQVNGLGHQVNGLTDRVTGLGDRMDRVEKRLTGVDASLENLGDRVMRVEIRCDETAGVSKLAIEHVSALRERTDRGFAEMGVRFDEIDRALALFVGAQGTINQKVEKKLSDHDSRLAALEEVDGELGQH